MDHSYISEVGFTIFMSPNCPYCVDAIKLLKYLNQRTNVSLSIIDFAQFPDNKATVLNFLKNNKHMYNFDINHTTRPIVFYNGKYIGGYNELKNFIN